MPTEQRIQRISNRVREELSEMLVREVSDPRLQGISVTEVKVDRELAYADIYVSAFEGVERSKEVLEGLERASAFLRHQLAQRIELRVFPRLRFRWDPTPERADRIERLLAEIREEREKQEGSAGEAPTAQDAEE
ncbi:MAG TPA: 30S ribosome-binding factor RbfA [Anaerolineaceae bacterium]|nr:30S ribosome-binding factor RbfA [Anaerolineaceae bacterium]